MKNMAEGEMLDGILSREKLPAEIIEEILSRLPVKSLLRFRCVCKAWHTLISEPRFVKTHLRHQHRKNKLHEVGRLWPRSMDMDGRGASLESQLGLTGKTILAIVDSCDGLVCVVDCLFRSPSPEGNCAQLILWNPSTRQHHHLPSPNFVPYSKYSICFFYDPENDDYMIARILTPKGMVRTRIDVFSLKTNKWRRVGETYGSVLAKGSGSAAYCNGNIHWVSSTNYDPNNKHRSIVAFSLREENFKEMRLPTRIISYLRVLGGRLCASGLYYRDFWIWGLEEYGWERLTSVSFPCRDRAGHDLCERFPLLLRFMEDDEIMLAHNRKMVICCSRNHTCMEIGSHHRLRQLYKTELGLCMDTLVSPFTLP